jgi:shikimate dehydrogenase
VNEDGRLVGTTTDPAGFLEGFHEAGHSFDGRTVAILGNGGTARTIAFALALNLAGKGRPAKVILAARDPAKTVRILNEIAAKVGAGIAESFEAATLTDYGRSLGRVKGAVDVVVNTTPMGMHPDTEASPIPAGDLSEGQVVYDIVYVPEKTRLLRDAEAAGLRTVGGLGMLVHQGRESFRLWTGVEPEAALFYAAARSQLAARSKASKAAEPAASDRK